VHVAPINHNLKAPGTQRVKVKHDGPLSNFAFKFNLRRYTKAKAKNKDKDAKVGRCGLTLSNPR
jgi:hypothetical protein